MHNCWLTLYLLSWSKSLKHHLKDTEELLLLDTLNLLLLHLQNIETNGLGEGTALSDSDNITVGDSLESRGQVGGDVLVPLLVTVVLGDVVQVITTNDNGPGHLGGDNHTPHDATTDGNITNPGALLVNVGALDGFPGGLESQTNILVVASGTATGLLGDTGSALTNEDGGLLLESVLSLLLKEGKRRGREGEVRRRGGGRERGDLGENKF